MAIALPLLLCAAVLCCYCCACCYCLLFSVDEHSTSSLTERLNGKGGGALSQQGEAKRCQTLRDGANAKKIHPSCYARMPQTLSNYALVALLCSCSKLISASPRCSHQQIRVLINPLECSATQVLSKQTTTKEVSDMKHPV